MKSLTVATAEPPRVVSDPSTAVLPEAPEPKTVEGPRRGAPGPFAGEGGRRGGCCSMPESLVRSKEKGRRRRDTPGCSAAAEAHEARAGEGIAGGRSLPLFH